jgi:hypothetical protein
MNKLKNFRHAVQSLIVFGVFWLEKSIEYNFLENKKTPPAIIWIVAAVGLMALLWTAEWLVNRWFDYSQKLRRLVLGDDFIEGTWFNKVKLSGQALYGLLHIEVREDGVMVHGAQYDENCKLTATWESR